MANKQFIYDIILNVKDNVNKKLKDLNGSLDDLLDGTRLGQFKQQFTDIFGKGASLLRGFGVLVGGVAAGLVAAGVAMFELYKANQQLNKELRQLRSVFKDIDTDALIEAKNRIQLLSEQTEESTEKITASINNLAKAYGITLPEAVQFYEEASLRGANAAGELADSVEEYSIQAKEAGLSVQQFQNLLINSTAEGIYKDKLSDLVKELNVVSTDTNKIRNSYKGIINEDILNTQLRLLREGSIGIAQFYVNINNEAKKAGVSVKDLTAANRALLGAVAEDAGGNAIEALDKSLKGIVPSLTEVQRLTIEENEASLRLSNAVDRVIISFSGLSNVFQKVKTSTLNFTAGIFEAFASVPDYLEQAEQALKRIEKIDASRATRDTQKSLNKTIEETKKRISDLKKQSEDLNFVDPNLTMNQQKEFIAGAKIRKAEIEKEVQVQLKLIGDAQKKILEIEGALQESEAKAVKTDINDFLRRSREIALRISQDRIQAQLAELEDLKSIDETRLEDLKSRQEEELKLTKELYQKQIAEANLAAETIIKSGLGKSLNESITQAQSNSFIKQLEFDANKGVKDAQDKLITINQAYANSASLRLEQENAIRDIKAKYDKEEEERIVAINKISDNIYQNRIDKLIQQLKLQVEQTSDTEKQAQLTKEIIKLETNKLAIKAKQQAIDALRSSGIDVNNLENENRLLNNQISLLEKISNIDFKGKFTLSDNEKESLKNLIPDIDINNLESSYDSIKNKIKELTNNLISFDSNSSVQKAIEKLKETAVLGSEEERQNATKTLEALEIYYNNVENLAKESAAKLIKIETDKLNNINKLLKVKIDEQQIIIDQSEKNQKDRQKRATAQSISELGDNIKSFRIGDAFKNVFDILDAQFTRKRRQISETIQALKEQRDLELEIAKNEAKNTIVSNVKVDSSITDPKQIEEESKRLRDEAIKRFDTLAELTEKYGTSEAIIRQKAAEKGIKDISDTEIAALIELNNSKSKINNDFNNKENEVNKSALQTTLKNTSEFFEKVSVIGRSVADVVGSVFQIINANAQMQLELLQEKIAQLQEQIAGIQALIADTESNISELETRFTESTGKRRADALRLQEAELDKLLKLKAAEASLTAEKQKSEAAAKQIDKEVQERARQLALINQVVATTSIIAASAAALEKAFTRGATVWDGIAGAVAAVAAIASLYATAKSVAKFEDGGLVTGNRHSQGGVPFTVAGQAGYEMEGGEYVMSRKAVQRLGVNTLDKLNFGNESIKSKQTKFQSGGFIEQQINSNLQTSNALESVISATQQLANRPIYVAVTDINSANNIEGNRMVSSTF